MGRWRRCCEMDNCFLGYRRLGSHCSTRGVHWAAKGPGGSVFNGASAHLKGVLDVRVSRWVPSPVHHGCMLSRSKPLPWIQHTSRRICNMKGQRCMPWYKDTSSHCFTTVCTGSFCLPAWISERRCTVGRRAQTVTDGNSLAAPHQCYIYILSGLFSSSCYLHRWLHTLSPPGTK